MTSQNKYKNSCLYPNCQRKYSTPGPHKNGRGNRFNTPVRQKYSNYNSKPHQGSQISRSTKQSNDYCLERQWKNKYLVSKTVKVAVTFSEDIYKFFLLD